MIPDLVETSPGSNVFFGTGNVFYDLGFPDAHERTIKMRLAAVVNRILKARKLTRKKAATLLGITPIEVTALRGFEIGAFPAEHLMHFACKLGYDVAIELRPKEASVTHVSVIVASAG